MSDPNLAEALDRAEGALARIERAIAAVEGDRRRETALRERVREVVGELDEMIRAAGGR